MKKKIAFVMGEMVIGGVEKVLIELLHQFDYDNYDVDLWIPKAGGDFDSGIDYRVTIKYYGDKNFLKHYAGIKSIYYKLMLRIYKNSWFLNSLFAVKSLPRLDLGTYDCVIAFKGLDPIVMATALYRFDSPLKIAWIHGANSYNDIEAKFFKHEFEKFSKIICVSKSTKENFCSKFNNVVDKAEVIYNALNSEEIIKLSKENIDESLNNNSIVTVGRLSKLKGQLLIPKAVSIILDKGYNIYWYLVGDGELKEEIRIEIEKYDVKENVIFLGQKLNPYPYIKACDIYVQPSLSEGFCTTTNEAKILNKPIVTTDAPGMREQFISGENGIIVDAMTSESIADGIQKLLDNPQLKEAFIENLKKSSFDNSAEIKKLYDAIDN